MLAAVQTMYTSATIAVSMGRRQGPELQSLTGVKQGCPLSPTMFGLLSDGLQAYLQALARADCTAVVGKIVDTDLGYADEFFLVSATADGLQGLIDAADGLCAAVGMQAGPAKSKVMEMTSHDLLEAQWTCSPVVGEARQPLQVVQQARYLGVTFQAGRGCLPTFAGLRSKALREGPNCGNSMAE